MTECSWTPALWSAARTAWSSKLRRAGRACGRRGSRCSGPRPGGRGWPGAAAGRRCAPDSPLSMFSSGELPAPSLAARAARRRDRPRRRRAGAAVRGPRRTPGPARQAAGSRSARRRGARAPQLARLVERGFAERPLARPARRTRMRSPCATPIAVESRTVTMQIGRSSSRHPERPATSAALSAGSTKSSNAPLPPRPIPTRRRRPR